MVLNPQAEAVEAEAEQVLLLMVDLAEVGDILHFQAVKEMQEVTLHPKEMTEELQLTQVVMVVAAVAVPEAQELQDQVNQALQVDRQYQIQYPDHR